MGLLSHWPHCEKVLYLSWLRDFLEVEIAPYVTRRDKKDQGKDEPVILWSLLKDIRLRE